MKICFLDNTSFLYNSYDLNSFKLRGAETVLINLAISLSKLNYKITIINNCPKNEIIDNIKWVNINNLNEKLYFDLAISNNDCRFFDKIVSKKKILISHSIQSLEKFIRKKQLFTYHKYKPKVALLGDYHLKNRNFFTRIYGHFILPYGVDDIFLKRKLKNELQIDRNLAIFTSRRDRNLDLLINIWIKKIYPNLKTAKLLTTPPENYKSIDSYNIFIRSTKDRSLMIDDLCKSRVSLIPGHSAELFCLAAEEARELCVPIITLGIGSLSERVIHNETGFIANNHEEFANYTYEIFKNDHLWNRLRSNLIKLRGLKNWTYSAESLLNNV